MSIKEEAEQGVTNKSVLADINKRITVTAAVFPFMFNPLSKLAHNKCKAPQLYNQQVKKVDMSP